MEWSFGQGTVNSSEGESEWGVHSDRGQSIRAKESPNGVVIRTVDSQSKQRRVRMEW
jgi:hypothetical protein